MTPQEAFSRAEVEDGLRTRMAINKLATDVLQRAFTSGDPREFLSNKREELAEKDSSNYFDSQVVSEAEDNLLPSALIRSHLNTLEGYKDYADNIPADFHDKYVTEKMQDEADFLGDNAAAEYRYEKHLQNIKRQQDLERLLKRPDIASAIYELQRAKAEFRGRVGVDVEYVIGAVKNYYRPRVIYATEGEVNHRMGPSVKSKDGPKWRDKKSKSVVVDQYGIPRNILSVHQRMSVVKLPPGAQENGKDYKIITSNQWKLAGMGVVNPDNYFPAEDPDLPPNLEDEGAIADFKERLKDVAVHNSDMAKRWGDSSFAELQRERVRVQVRPVSAPRAGGRSSPGVRVA